MAINNINKDIIEMFMRMGDVAGIPDIIMKVYGVIWMSETPISQSEILDALKNLQLSLGKTVISVSLKELTQLGIIDKVKGENERTYSYQSNCSLLEIYQLSVSKILGPAELRKNKFNKKHGDKPLGEAFLKEIDALHSFLKHMINNDIKDWIN